MGPGSAKQRFARAARCIAPGTREIINLNHSSTGERWRAELHAYKSQRQRMRGNTMERMFFVYIVASRRNGTLYIGVTNNLARRIAEHKAGLVPGFTRQYEVNRLVYFELFESVREARAREYTMKRWRRAWKIELIETLNPDWRDLSAELNA
jgi:putative endonuclease